MNQINYEININNRNELIKKKELYEKEIFSVENAMLALSDEEKRLIEYKYFEKLRWIDIQKLMKISKSGLVAREKIILNKIGEIINI